MFVVIQPLNDYKQDFIFLFFLGKCLKNTFKCLDGSEVSCELSCTILGFIPCSKYRNRISCLRDYPDALGSYYKNSYKLAQSTIKSTNYFSNSYIFYILGKYK